MTRIDLSTVPSAMEETARLWGGNPTPQPPIERVTPAPRAALPSQPRPQHRAVPKRAAVTPPHPSGDPAHTGGPASTSFGVGGIEKVPTPDPDELRARKDALRSFLCSGTPDPATFARYLPKAAADVLQEARCVHSYWRYTSNVPPDVMKWLRSSGLAYIDKRDDCLTIFAQAVRRALVEGRA